MALLTKPQARAPLGTVELPNGQRLPVVIQMEWDRFLTLLQERAGGVSGVGTSDLSVAAFEDAGIEETKALLNTVQNDIGQLPIPVQAMPEPEAASGELSALREEVETLRTRLTALEQGTVA